MAIGAGQEWGGYIQKWHIDGARVTSFCFCPVFLAGQGTGQDGQQQDGRASPCSTLLLVSHPLLPADTFWISLVELIFNIKNTNKRNTSTRQLFLWVMMTDVLIQFQSFEITVNFEVLVVKKMRYKQNSINYHNVKGEVRQFFFICSKFLSAQN